MKTVSKNYNFKYKSKRKQFGKKFPTKIRKNRRHRSIEIKTTDSSKRLQATVEYQLKTCSVYSTGKLRSKIYN